MSVSERVKSLELPADSAVVIGSSVLRELGIIPHSNDLDLALTPGAFMELESRQGWVLQQARGTTLVTCDDIEGGVGFDGWSVDDLLEDAIRIDEVPFISLQKLHAWKVRENRPKDVEHIRLLTLHLLGGKPGAAWHAA